MAIPNHRVAVSKPLEKERKRLRRKNAKVKDKVRKLKKKTVERRHVKMEKILEKEWKSDEYFLSRP
tara:strand:+ start:127 stop:324 length:198 start_codon:yes stop_codon:yes gene_type:complete